MVGTCSDKRTRGLRFEGSDKYLLLGAGGAHIEEVLKDDWVSLLTP